MQKFFVFFIVFVFSFPIHAKKRIRVGGYMFPPFVEIGEQGKVSGLTLDLIDALNKIQSEYHFEFYLTSSKRRYKDFQNKKFDTVFCEMMEWGWKDFPVDASKVFLNGGEVYISYKTKHKNQKYFDDLKNKSIAGILGYHYSVFGFNADELYLKKHFNAILTTDHIRSIELVEKNRVDLSIVTKSFLLRYLKNNPKAEKKLLVSEIYDQKYNHTILLRSKMELTADQINQYLNTMNTNGTLARLKTKYYID